MKTTFSITLVLSIILFLVGCSAGNNKSEALQEAATNGDSTSVVNKEISNQEVAAIPLPPDFMMFNLKGKVSRCSFKGFRDMLELGETVYQFDKDGNLSSIGGKKINAKRNSTGQIEQIKFLDYDDMGEEQTNTINLKYDKNGRVDKVKVQTYCDNWESLLTYNEEGQLVKKVTKGVEQISYNYTYKNADSQGNWTKRVSISSPIEAKNTETREITYYE